VRRAACGLIRELLPVSSEEDSTAKGVLDAAIAPLWTTADQRIAASELVAETRELFADVREPLADVRELLVSVSDRFA